MERADRIREMEQCLDKASQAVTKLAWALEEYLEVREDLATLTAYYDSPLWREVLEADEAGALPKDLKRGVLSEDAVYDLLTDHKELLDLLEEALDAEKEETK